MKLTAAEMARKDAQQVAEEERATLREELAQLRSMLELQQELNLRLHGGHEMPLMQTWDERRGEHAHLPDDHRAERVRWREELRVHDEREAARAHLSMHLEDIIECLWACHELGEEVSCCMLDQKTPNSPLGVSPSFLHEQHSCMREMGKEHRYACHHARMRSRWKWFQHKGKQVQRALEREAYRSTQSLASPPAGETCTSQRADIVCIRIHACSDTGFASNKCLHVRMPVSHGSSRACKSERVCAREKEREQAS